MPTTSAPLPVRELRVRLDRLPRLRLAHLPTPLEPLTRLSSQLGGPGLWVKRDDLTGLAFGGNKVRHFEFLIAHIRRAGYDAVVNAMDWRSNNARLAAAACNRAGLAYALALYNTPDGVPQGNQLVDHLLGARIRQSAGPPLQGLELGEELAGEMEAAGQRPYRMWKHLMARVAGMIGYVDCALELLPQLQAAGLTRVHFYSVAGRSLCGLALAARNLGLPWSFTGVLVTRELTMQEYILQYRQDIQRLLDLPCTFAADDLELLDGYIGDGYGIMTPEVREAIRLAGRVESLLLDPNYTGTVMAGLLNQLRHGALAADVPVVFLHTGGLPGLFAQAGELAGDVARQSP